MTDISGRGVGMDVVRRAVEALRGRIDVQTTTGRGTTFLIRLPLTLAIVDGLLLQVGSQRFVVPTFSVAESLRAQPQQVHTVQGHTCLVQVRDRLLPLVRLADLFGIGEATSDPAEGTIVVLEADDRHVAVMVDSLLGKQEVVIKSLGTVVRQCARDRRMRDSGRRTRRADPRRGRHRPVPVQRSGDYGGLTSGRAGKRE